MMNSLFERVANTVGEGEKWWLPAFSPFPNMFSKAFFSRVAKSGLCGKELTLPEQTVVFMCQQ